MVHTGRMSKLPRVEVDFTSLNSTPVGRLKLGPVDGPDGDPDLAALWLVREQRVLFYDAERQVEGSHHIAGIAASVVVHHCAAVLAGNRQ